MGFYKPQVVIATQNRLIQLLRYKRTLTATKNRETREKLQFEESDRKVTLTIRIEMKP